MPARLRIEKLVYGGDGLAHHGGETVFVPFVLPGEEVEVDLAERPAGVFRGSVVRRIGDSAGRSAAPCSVFGKCGGCHYQHIPYDRECEFKAAILRETLRRIGGLAWEGEIGIESAEPWGYRNRTQLHLGRSGGRPSVGFLAPRSHRHVEASECPINAPRLNELHRKLREMTRVRRLPGSIRSIEFFVSGDQAQISLPGRRSPLPRKFRTWCADGLDVNRPGAPLDCPSGPDQLRVSGRSFFQVNRFLVARLAELATRGARGRLALDLFSGVGLLTLPLARRCSTVYGVDSSRAAIGDLRANAARAGLPVQAVRMRVADFLRGFAGRPSLIVADPPRAGLGGQVVEEILRLAPPELRLVSCNPATLARDIRSLLAGGYQVESIRLIDMFPQTYHIESLVLLRRH